MLFFASPSSSQSASQNASSRGSLRSLFSLPAATASGPHQAQLLDLGEQLVWDLHAAGTRGPFAREAPRARQPYLGLGKHRRDQGFNSFREFFGSRERRRVDDDERLADARAVALLREKRVGLRPDRRAGERGADQLEHQREHRALRAADGKQAAAFD